MLKRFYRFGQVAGLAIHIGQDGSCVMDGCLLELQGDELSVIAQFDGLTDLNRLKKHLPDGTLLALNISGKGIVTKRLPQAEELNKALPNIDSNAFDIQHAPAADQVFLSLIRKTEAERWFNQLKETGLLPLSLSLGPFVAMQLDRELNVTGPDLVFHGHVISRDDQGAWTGQRYVAGAKAGSKLKMQQETLAESVILPYAAAFQLLLDGQLQRIAAPAELFETALTGKIAQQKFRVHAAAVLVAIFALLLINFGVFSWLSSANDRLNDQLSRLQQSSTDIRATIADVERKEALLKTLGWDGDIPKAKMVDQLAALLPADIRWTSVSVDPVKQVRGQGADQIGFDTNTIRIAGQTDKVLSVNEWLARIRTKTWVKQAVLNNYTFDQPANTGVFNLTITY